MDFSEYTFISFASTCFILGEYILLVVGDVYICVSVIIVIVGVLYTMGVCYIDGTVCICVMVVLV